MQMNLLEKAQLSAPVLLLQLVDAVAQIVDVFLDVMNGLDLVTHERHVPLDVAHLHQNKERKLSFSARPLREWLRAMQNSDLVLTRLDGARELLQLAAYLAQRRTNDGTHLERGLQLDGVRVTGVIGLLA